MALGRGLLWYMITVPMPKSKPARRFLVGNARKHDTPMTIAEATAKAKDLARTSKRPVAVLEVDEHGDAWLHTTEHPDYPPPPPLVAAGRRAGAHYAAGAAEDNAAEGRDFEINDLAKAKKYACGLAVDGYDAIVIKVTASGAETIVFRAPALKPKGDGLVLGRVPKR